MRKKKLCFPIRLSAALIQFDVPEEYYIVIKLIFRMSLVQTVFFFYSSSGAWIFKGTRLDCTRIILLLKLVIL